LAKRWAPRSPRVGGTRKASSDATRWWAAWHRNGSGWTTYEIDDTDHVVELHAAAHVSADDVRIVGVALFGLSPMRTARWDGGSLSPDSVPAPPW